MELDGQWQHLYPGGSISQSFGSSSMDSETPAHRLAASPLSASASERHSSCLQHIGGGGGWGAWWSTGRLPLHLISHADASVRHPARSLVSSPGLMVFLRAPSAAQICQLIRWKPNLHGHDHSKELPKSGDANKQTVEIIDRADVDARRVVFGGERLCTS